MAAGDPTNPLPLRDFAKVDLKPYVRMVQKFVREVAASSDLGRQARLNFIGAEVLDEVERARRKHGAQAGIPDGTGGPYWAAAAQAAKEVTDRRAEAGLATRLDIVREEVFEAFAESDPEKLRAELIQAAAMLHAWIYDIDTRS